MAADQINPFSVRVLTLDSALRFVYFSVEESRKSLEELAVDDDEANEKGRQRAIRLFRALQSKIVDYAQLRGSIDNQREEELLVEELKLLQKEASIFLAKIKGAWQSDKAIKLLERTISLEKGIKKILKRLKRETPSESEYFYAGIDGGATHTKTVVSDKNGKIIGKAESGPSFPMLVGVIKTFDSLITGLKKATEDAGLNFETTYFRRICAGMCGIDTPEDHQRMNELMQKYIRRFHSNIGDAIIIQDSLLAWYGSFNGEPGIIIIGGTGHMVYGYNNGRDAAMKGNTRDWRKVVTIGGRFIAYHAALNIEEKLGKKSNTILVRALRSAFREGKIFSEYKNIAFTFLPALIAAVANWQAVKTD